MTVECLVPVAFWYLSPVGSSVLHSANIPAWSTYCLPGAVLGLWEGVHRVRVPPLGITS